MRQRWGVDGAEGKVASLYGPITCYIVAGMARHG